MNIKPIEQTSLQYLKSCIEIFSIADKIAEGAMIEMFITYAQKVLVERQKTNILTDEEIIKEAESESRERRYLTKDCHEAGYEELGFEDGAKWARGIIDERKK